jgi:hypothetical protein
MKKKFNKIFLKSIRIINWFESPGFLGMQKAGNILFVIFIFVGSLLHFFKGVSSLLNNILFGLLVVILYSLFFLLSLRVYWIKPPKFIRRANENPGQLFDVWGHWPYLYGIMIYSFFASFFMGGILLAIMHIILELKFNFSKIYYTLFFLTAATFSVFYFMYHVSVKGISTKVVKARIRL